MFFSVVTLAVACMRTAEHATRAPGCVIMLVTRTGGGIAFRLISSPPPPPSLQLAEGLLPARSIAAFELSNSVDRRRRGFASDLYEQFDLVKAISHDPDVMEQQRIEAERFSQAFDACANRARKVVETSVY